jgi:hypothetical protein
MADTHFYASKLDLVTKLTFTISFSASCQSLFKKKKINYLKVSNTKTKELFSSVANLLKHIYFSAM